MSETATINPPIDERILDELVPPPGPRWRRVVLWLAFLGIVGAFSWAFTSGTVTPHVSINVESWGGTGPVSVTTSVQNNSRVDIEVVGGPRPRPGLTLIGYATGRPTDDLQPKKRPSNPFPLRLGPGESIQITAWYRVGDCQAIKGIDRNDDAIDLQVRIADGPASWISTERSSDQTLIGWIGADLGTDQPLGKSTRLHQASWAAGISEHACKK